MRTITRLTTLFNWLLPIAALLLLIGLSNCANERAPEGGKKDVTPPKAKKMQPANKTLRFTGDKIQITFDEYIKPTGFAQVLISPPLEKRPDFKLNGKTLTIKLKSALRDSTTYTINFAEDIKDVNEGNALNNFSYVFSTGDFIDSQKVSGKVIMAKDNTPADGVVVALYPSDSGDAIKTSKPYYFGKTDKSGNFKIENIKAGNYNIFGLKDQNYDYMYNQPNELIAFSDSLVAVHDSVEAKIDLFLFDELEGQIKYAGNKSIQPGLLQIYYTKPPKSFKLEMDTIPTTSFWYHDRAKDTINYWFSSYYDKKTTAIITANDTLVDTATIELKNIVKDSLWTRQEYALMPVNQQGKTSPGSKSKENYNAQELYKPLIIAFPRPIMEINAAKTLQLLQDSVPKNVELHLTVTDTTRLAVSVDFAMEENTSYTVIIPDSTLRDIFGMWNKKITYKFKTNTKDNYGNINLVMTAEHPLKHYIVKLINANNEVVKELRFTGDKDKVHIPNLAAGTYKLSAIDDINNNGQWDTGDFKKKLQPEKVISFKDTYNLKGGWDLDIEVKL